MALFQRAVFVASFDDLRDLPALRSKEIAFAGRSNAGKSSAINALANRKRLAYLSKSPGRTHQINFFSLGNARYLVDLPGYGYARVPAKLRLHWELLLETTCKQENRCLAWYLSWTLGTLSRRWINRC